MSQPDPASHHATCVAVNGRGLLIMGPSGSGKSGLALQMLGLGAQLVADDRVLLDLRDGQLFARPPATLAGLIEARGLGILQADALPETQVCAVLDLAQRTTDRMPPTRTITLLGCETPLFYAVDTPHFAAALVQFLKAGLSQR